ncbi:MAG: TSUP family transporter [Candidatus Omnitrophota bacterium]
MQILIYFSIGIFAGLVGGFFGLGGGIVMVPVFVYLLGMTQHQAQGTALAALALPITLLAALRYYHAGNVKLQIAALACLGFVGGGLLGAHMVQNVPPVLLKRLFGGVMFLVSIKMIVGR